MIQWGKGHRERASLRSGLRHGCSGAGAGQSDGRFSSMGCSCSRRRRRCSSSRASSSLPGLQAAGGAQWRACWSQRARDWWVGIPYPEEAVLWRAGCVKAPSRPAIGAEAVTISPGSCKAGPAACFAAQQRARSQRMAVYPAQASGFAFSDGSRSTQNSAMPCGPPQSFLAFGAGRTVRPYSSRELDASGWTSRCARGALS